MIPIEQIPIQVIDLGSISYQKAWDLQTNLQQSIITNKRSGYSSDPTHYLLLCEHPPVFTLGKSGSMDNLLLNDLGLAQNEIEFFKINRGGDITFHGPGQLVGYPILDLDLIFTDVHRYVRSLEEMIIGTLQNFGILGHREEKYTGVWVHTDDIEKPEKKICAIGVHLSRWVSMHGFALNVNTELQYFDHIIPCGIAAADKSVCSISSILEKHVTLQEVKDKLVQQFGLVFDRTVTPASLDLSVLI